MWQSKLEKPHGQGILKNLFGGLTQSKHEKALGVLKMLFGELTRLMARLVWFMLKRVDDDDELQITVDLWEENEMPMMMPPSSDVDKVFLELNKRKLKEKYIEEFGSLEFKTATCGREGDIAGQISVTFPDQLFSMDDESIEALLTMVRDFVGFAIGCSDFAEWAVPIIYETLVEGGRGVMAAAMEEREGDEGVGDMGPGQNPGLN